MIPPAFTYQPNAMVSLVATLAHQVICWLAQPTLTASMVLAVMPFVHLGCVLYISSQSGLCLEKAGLVRPFQIDVVQISHDVSVCTFRTQLCLIHAKWTFGSMTCFFLHFQPVFAKQKLFVGFETNRVWGGSVTAP